MVEVFRQKMNLPYFPAAAAVLELLVETRVAPAISPAREKLSLREIF